MKRILFTVAEGRAVRDPITKKMLPGNGELIEKIDSSFWQKRLKQGDILIGVMPKKASVAVAEKTFENNFVKEK